MKSKTYILSFSFLVVSVSSVLCQTDQEIWKKITQENNYRDSIYSPLLNNCTDCVIFCSNGDSSVLSPQAGYIVKKVSFNANDIIECNELLPYKPTIRGKQNVLFLYFNPDLTENAKCNSSNFVLFIDSGSLRKRNKRQISKSVQFALFAGPGGPFLRFEKTLETNGWIKIVDVKNGIAHIRLGLDFGIREEDYNSIMLDFRVRVLGFEEILSLS